MSSKLTDFELNKAIAETLGFDVAEHIAPETGVYCNAYTGYQMVDYCNKWNDLMPLVVKHAANIWIDTEKDDAGAELEWWGGKEYLHGPVKSSYVVFNKNPQRALAECLIKILTITKDKDSE